MENLVEFLTHKNPYDKFTLTRLESNHLYYSKYARMINCTVLYLLLQNIKDVTVLYKHNNSNK